jgi:hypothetical protein
MAAILGLVIYWFSCLLALAVLIGFGLRALYVAPNPWVPLGWGVAFAFGLWLIGRACLFVLAGR